MDSDDRDEGRDADLLLAAEGAYAIGVSYPATVLVVDDDASIVRLLTLFLRREHYTVLTASSAAEALPILREQRWDIAILDRRLPDSDGLDLCRTIRQDPALSGRFVILLTADSGPAERIAGLELGADDYVGKPFQLPELLARVRAAKRVVDLQKALLDANRRLRLLSVTDDLTGTFNRRQFRVELVRALEQAIRYERPLSLAIVDIDHFKQVNDAAGHETGDQILRKVARVLSRCIRASDILARFGGEEFAIILPETSYEDALQFGEKVRAAIEQTRFIDASHNAVPVTISVGTASLPHSDLRSSRDFLNAADKALYRAKREGRNRVEAERRRSGRVDEPPVATN